MSFNELVDADSSLIYCVVLTQYFNICTSKYLIYIDKPAAAVVFYPAAGKRSSVFGSDLPLAWPAGAVV